MYLESAGLLSHDEELLVSFLLRRDNDKADVL